MARHSWSTRLVLPASSAILLLQSQLNEEFSDLPIPFILIIRHVKVQREAREIGKNACPIVPGPHTLWKLS